MLLNPFAPFSICSETVGHTFANLATLFRLPLMTSTMGGHGRWREIGTQRCAGAFLPAGRRDARVVDDYGSGYVAETLKKNRTILFCFCPRKEASPKLWILLSFFVLMIAYLWSLRIVRFQRKLRWKSKSRGEAIRSLLNWWF